MCYFIKHFILNSFYAHLASYTFKIQIMRKFKNHILIIYFIYLYHFVRFFFFPLSIFILIIHYKVLINNYNIFIGIKKMCEFQGIKQLEGSQWEFECNTCLCKDGKVICLRVSLIKSFI